jgi:hypothetical protein
MARTCLLTGEDAEIGSVQDGAQPCLPENASAKGRFRFGAKRRPQNKDFSPQGCPQSCSQPDVENVPF